MTTEMVLRMVTLNELGLMVAVAATIILTVVVLRYVDERWTFIPRRKQRKGFNERW